MPDMVVFDSIFIKGSKKEYSKAPAQGDLDLIIGKGKLGIIHSIMYKYKFLRKNNLMFNATTIQQENRDFNFSVIKLSPVIKRIESTVYLYYYQLTSTVYRWKRQPDKMIDGGIFAIEKTGNIFLNPAGMIKRHCLLV